MTQYYKGDVPFDGDRIQEFHGVYLPAGYFDNHSARQHFGIETEEEYQARTNPVQIAPADLDAVATPEPTVVDTEVAVSVDPVETKPKKTRVKKEV